ncbi:MAG: hypothetical protein IJB31_03215 [Akkermansia sp.]|nr:hypothetical protein [Akkermansia sp.]
MKMNHISVAAVLVAALFCSSCVVSPDGYYGPYGTYSVSTNGYNTSVAWTNASYDANGFPIFGYSYGRPVYGYTEAGVAIFTVAALTALCFVPSWRPAPWYHGHWHYPHHCHRVAAPPRHPHGHAPGVRPHGGMNAPIHRNPGSVFNKHPKPAGGMHHSHHGNAHRPNNNIGRPNHGNAHRPNNNIGRPNHGNANRPNNNIGRPNNNIGRPNHGNANRPNNNVGRPNHGNVNRPNNNIGRPNHGNANRPNNNTGHSHSSVNRPGRGNRPSSSVTRPASAGRPTGMSRPSGMSRPTGLSRPTGMSRPTGGGRGHRR